MATNKSLAKPNQEAPLPTNKDFKDGYEWLFDTASDPKADAEHERHKEERRKRASDRRKEGYEWLLG